MSFKKHKLIKSQYGLTLIETTIGLGILMVGIMASLTVMYFSFKYSQQAEYEIVVVNLAREGVEIVRAMRNNEDDLNVNDFDIFALSENTNYHFDIEDSNTTATIETDNKLAAGVNTANTCTECALYFKNGKYVHDSSGGATPTIYNRLIKIEDTNPVQTGVKKIISEISWTVKNKTYSYDLETYLYDWQ